MRCISWDVISAVREVARNLRAGGSSFGLEGVTEFFPVGHIKLLVWYLVLMEKSLWATE